jgi:hypothetical protein
MSAIDLLEPLFTDGIATPSYFNGRVLSAEDLSQSASAQRQVDRLLGQAIGEGVAHGLEVSVVPNVDGAPAVRAEAGLAINRRGAVVRLGTWQVIKLAASLPVSGGAPGFADCGDVPGPVFSGSAGVYLLTIGPVQGTRGMAPVTGLRNASATCNVREVVDGVQFRMIPLTITGVSATSPQLRNQVAIRCLGLRALKNLKGFAPGGQIASYGLLDDLRQAKQLTACEVPLATLRLTADAVAFIDGWSVRRRLIQPVVASRWPHLVDDRRLAEAEALFLQFEDQVATIAPTGQDVSSVNGSAHFAWYPPAGVLPVGTGRFKPATFFKEQTLEMREGDHALARQVIHNSFYREPFESNDVDVVIRVLTFEDHPEYVVFTRTEPLPVQAPVEVQPQPAPGGFDIRVTWTGPAATSPDIERVWVQDDRGTQINAQPVTGGGSGTFFDQFLQITNERTYRIGGLAPGGYFVKVQARNAPTASVRATAIAKSSVLVDVILKRSPEPCPPRWELEKPVDRVKADRFTKMVDTAGNSYGSATVMHDYRSYATAIPESYAKPQQMQFTQGQVAELVDRWRCRLTWRPIEEVVTQLEPELWIDPRYDPNLYPPPDDPYAYLKIDDFAYPIILTTEDRTLPVTLPATEAGIPETNIDRYVSVLAPMGLGDLDVLAGAWGGLLQDALGVPAVAVATVAQELGTTAADALEQKLYYPGVSAEIGTALKADGWTDVEIANASVAEMTSALESLDGIELSDDAAAGLASRLVGVARTIVPAEAWSLDDEAIGLDSATRETLRESGVETKGGLAAASQETLATVAEAAGVTTEAITEAQAKSEVAKQAIDIALTASPTLTDVGLSKEQAGTLAEHGVTTVAELVTADVDLTSVLALDEEQATAIKGNATTAVTTTWGAVATREGVDFQQSLGSLASSPLFSSVNKAFRGGIG